MPVNIEQWRASIGLFQPVLGLQTVSGFRDLRFVNYKVVVFLVFFMAFLWWHSSQPWTQEKTFKPVMLSLKCK